MWTCVEDRIDDGTEFGCMIRKIIFDDIYADRKAAITSNPIPPTVIKHLKVILCFLLQNMYLFV